MNTPLPTSGDETVASMTPHKDIKRRRSPVQKSKGPVSSISAPNTQMQFGRAADTTGSETPLDRQSVLDALPAKMAAMIGSLVDRTAFDEASDARDTSDATKAPRRVGLMTKLVAGGPGRKSRLHTELGDAIPLSQLHHIGTVARDFVRTRLTGKRPDQPWWPMSVIPQIENHLTGTATVLEFGCGSSSLWLARRAQRVIAIEDDPGWAEKIRMRAREMKLDNLEIVVRSGTQYFDLSAFAGLNVDLAIVDGSYRWKCLGAVLPLMNDNSVVYLDNSDADKDIRWYNRDGMEREVQKGIEAYAATHPEASVERYVSFISGELYAGEGTILRMGRRS